MRFSLACWLALAGLLLGCSNGAQPDATETAEVGQDAPETDQAPPSAQSSSDPEAVSDTRSDGRLELEQITLEVPESWEPKQTTSGFVLAEYELPAPEGVEEEGRLTVSIAGGSIEANIERWRSQFGGEPERESKDEFEVVGLPVTVVDFSGDFKDQRGPFAPATQKSDYRMLAAIISVDDQLHFIKATGPEETIEAHADQFDAFVRSVRPN